MNGHSLQTAPNALAVIYDNDCPVCRFYVTFLCIEEHIQKITLVDARNSSHALVREARARGLNLDEGFVLVVGTQFYHGADAIHRLALLGSCSTFWSRVNHWVFRSPVRSLLLYPILNHGRKALLFLLRRKPIAHDT